MTHCFAVKTFVRIRLMSEPIPNSVDKRIDASEEGLLAACVKTFKEVFEASPTYSVKAPGRLNFIGEHIDYNDGFVLPAAIDKCFQGVYRENQDGIIRVYSRNFKSLRELKLSEPLKAEAGDWLNYLRGVLAQFEKKSIKCPGFDLVLESDIPMGGGLSSSAALEVVFATIVESLLDLKMDGMEKALLCQRAEHEYAGVPCGIMDQAAVALCERSSFLKLDCRDLSFDQVPFDDSHVSILVVDTKVKHSLADGAYAKRRRSCENALINLGFSSYRDESLNLESLNGLENEEERMRARHVIGEIKRTTDAIEALKAGEFETVGKLLNESHFSLQKDFEVSCDELDFVTEIARRQQGVYGSRMTGGGFGGSAIVFLEKKSVDAVKEAIATAYTDRFGIEAGIFATSAAGGVQWSKL